MLLPVETVHAALCATGAGDAHRRVCLGEDIDLTEGRLVFMAPVEVNTAYFCRGTTRAMGRAKHPRKQAPAGWFSSSMVCGIITLSGMLGPLQPATADDASPSPDPAVSAPPSTGPTPELPPSTTAPVDPFPLPELPPVGEVSLPPGPPSQAPAESVSPPVVPAPVEVMPVAPALTAAAVTHSPVVVPFQDPVTETSSLNIDPLETTSRPETSAALAPASASPTATAPAPAQQQRASSPVEQAVSVAAGSPLVVQLLTITLILGAGAVYFRLLGNKGMRTPSRSVK